MNQILICSKAKTSLLRPCAAIQTHIDIQLLRSRRGFQKYEHHIRWWFFKFMKRVSQIINVLVVNISTVRGRPGKKKLTRYFERFVSEILSRFTYLDIRYCYWCFETVQKSFVLLLIYVVQYGSVVKIYCEVFSAYWYHSF